MEHHHEHTTMHQKIFTLGLSTVSVSTYLLCCGLADIGNSITLDNLKEIWTGTSAELEAGIRDLASRRILRVKGSGDVDSAVYRLTDVHDWMTG